MDQGGEAPKKNASVRQLLRQQRELQEKRKFGLAPLAVDTETHQEISPNIPEFISRAPWYYGASGPTLAHQRKLNPDGTEPTSADEVLSDAVDRIVVKGQATRYTAGACKNCGSRTHKTAECFQAKKKVGSVYTNKITGVDMETVQQAKTYAQKRDRFVGEVGVDLMRGVKADADGDDPQRGDSAEGAPPLQRSRPQDVFGTRTAQHGGLEVKELPKYLHNLDQHEGLFFDPKTGSMRANPNAADSTKAFQGDLERYRSGDYYNYVEAQYRFLTGQSKAFVDFEFDEAMQRERQQQQQAKVRMMAGGRGGETDGDTAEGQAAPETAQEVLLRSLYGTRAAESAVVGSTPPATAAAPATLEVSAAPPAESLPGGSRIQAAALSWRPTRNGHRSVYGSFFDPATFQWGYACCKATGKMAPGCSGEGLQMS